MVSTLTPSQPKRALEGLRVLDLSRGIAGPFAARLLGDLGADVIKVEEPGRGDFARMLAPLIAEAPRPEQSLLFQYLNWNKRGIELDLRDAASRPLLRQLVEQSDVLIEAFRPGTLDRWGIGADEMRAWNPRLVVTSISNFGQKGPYADYAATDLTFYAMGGVMQISGRVDRQPLKHGLHQSLFCAGLSAAYATIAAWLAVQRGGATGEHVDLSIHECMVSQLVLNVPFYTMLGAIQGRRAVVQDAFQGEPIPTRRGYLSLQNGGGMPFTDFADLLNLPALRDQFVRREDREEHADELRAVLEAALKDRAAGDVFVEGASRRLLTGFVQDAEDLLACPHLEAREFWADLSHPATGAHRFPGELVKLAATPMTVRRRAPMLGEHTAEVIAELAAPEERQAPGSAARIHRGRPLAGMRVLDLSSVFAVPYLGALLSDLGAEVIKIEGPQRPDTTRGSDWIAHEAGPSEDPWNREGNFQILNRGKRDLVLNMASEDGRRVFKELLAKSDIVINNFTPRVLPGWGLDYAAMAAIRPDVILLSNCGYGSTGPWSPFPSQGTTLEATMGITAYTGYADDKPWKAGQSYPDFVTCWTGLVALLGAVAYRERTGEGQAIDLGMYQAGVALIPEPLLALQADGRQLHRIGNEDYEHVPSNVYAAQGADTWLAISIVDDEGWGRLAALMDQPELATDAGFATEAARRARRREVNGIVAEWAGGQDAREAAGRLQAAGIAAGAVLDARSLLVDEHLRSRGFFEYVQHWEPLGVRPIIGRPYRFANTELAIEKAAPRFGEDNRYVLRDLLDMPEERIAALYAAEVVSDRPLTSGSYGTMDLEPGLRNGTIKEVDPGYRAVLGLGQA